MTIINSLTHDGFVITQPVTINGPGARLLTISGGDDKPLPSSDGRDSRDKRPHFRSWLE